MRAAIGPAAAVHGDLGDAPLTAEEIKFWQNRLLSAQGTAISIKCIEEALTSNRPVPKGTTTLAPSSSNSLAVSCKSCKTISPYGSR